MQYAYGITITVRRGGRDPRTGDPLPTTQHTIAGCAVAPRFSSETTNLGNAVVTGYTVLGPYRMDVLATDEVQLPGDPTWWQVEGERGDWRNPFTDWEAGSQVALTRQRGA